MNFCKFSNEYVCKCLVFIKFNPNRHYDSLGKYIWQVIRTYIHSLSMGKTELRKLRTYKTKDSIYKKAMERSKKERFKISKLIEGVLCAFGNGYIISATQKLPGQKQADLSIDLKKKKHLPE